MKKDKKKHVKRSRKGIKYSLLLSVSLMSVIPFLVLAYVVINYVFDTPELIFRMTFMILCSIWLAAAGYLLAKKIIIPIIGLAMKTKNIADGDYSAKVDIGRDDELGDIANSVNTMTAKIRGYIGELQEYSEKTASLNLQIHKKVLTLTNLMKVGDLISSGTEFSEIADFVAERIAGELYGGFCLLFIKNEGKECALKAMHDNSGHELSAAGIEAHIESVEKIFPEEEYFLIDSRPLKKARQKELKDKLEGMNIIFFPIKMDENIVGMMCAGSFIKGTKFEEENIDMLRAFEKELALAYQSERICKRVKSLEIVDKITGLYTFSYLKERLNDEIKRAVYYQRPCSLFLVRIDSFEEYANYYGEGKTKNVLKRIGKLLSSIIPTVGKVARSSDGEFGVLLPEVNKRESLDIAETARERIENMKISSSSDDVITVSVGVSENPIDGGNADEIIEKAREFTDKAQADGGNKVLGE
ncbi:MAG: diguanylate cyclase [Candidatus Omnitrophica bacterium]|nr:diguanylate cyclase [Candidatus Omnitrophota bacterium]